ncbi:MAG: plastocyanin/azurin family copper-binding protein [Actinomycetota bacterium]|nr:plastocyanin/azurin family copper-binding protein [Actinomycetota bacterium]
MSTSLSRRPVRALLLIIALLAAFGSASALGASSSVKVEDNFFSAKKLSVSRNTSVTWNWKGALYHNVKVRSGPAKFSSRTQLHGSFVHRFTTRGTYKLYCSLHPDMTMTVTVR